MWMFTALLMGLAGSIHCAGMCGPIAMLIAGGREPGKIPVGRTLLYNSGRVITYSALGALSGLAGHSVLWFSGQQWLSVIAGVIILLSLAMTQLNIPFLKKISAPVYDRLRKALSGILKKKNPGTLLYMGVLNGLLPCGLVYAALGGAAATGSMLNGVIFMALFGTATVPVLFGISMAGAKISPVVYKKLVKLVPVTIALLALLLIVRGMGLGIPYVSPAIEGQQVACCHMQH